jgi:hypothetical protein
VLAGIASVGRQHTHPVSVAGWSFSEVHFRGHAVTTKKAGRPRLYPADSRVFF